MTTQVAVGAYDGSESAAEAPPEYDLVDGCTVWRTTDRGGAPTDLQLANFGARIVERVVVDDGAEQCQHVTIEATCDDVTTRFTLPVKVFAAMTWVEEKIGPHAIVEVGWAFRDRLRAAIQHLSGTPPTRTVLRHVGWRAVPGSEAFVDASGAVGPRGRITDVSVEPPPALQPMSMIPPPDAESLKAAVLASLRVLEAGPLHVTLPAYAGVWRSVLGPVDFALGIVGKTGQFKSAFAALLQQHFGAGFVPAQLPGSWSSTENALEELAFLAKDMLVVIDDFAPGGAPERVRALQAKAERIFRAAGNRQGRQRMRADTSLRPVRPPRGLILSTGEDLPEGQSIRARIVVVEVGKGDIDRDRLTNCQRDADAGLYAGATAGFVSWLSARLDVVRTAARETVERLATEVADDAGHRRTARAAAELLYGYWTFLVFARELEAIDDRQRDGLWAAAKATLKSVVEKQAEHQVRTDPAELLLEAIRAALLSGQAHFTTLEGAIPEPREPLGWRLGSESSWRASGTRIGWIDEGGAYLEPKTAFMIARRIDPKSVAVSEDTLVKRLHESGHIASVEVRDGKTRYRVRRTVSGQRVSVLHLLRTSLFDEVAPTASAAAAARSRDVASGDAGYYGVEGGPTPSDDRADGPSGPV